MSVFTDGIIIEYFKKVILRQLWQYGILFATFLNFINTITFRRLHVSIFDHLIVAQSFLHFWFFPRRVCFLRRDFAVVRQPYVHHVQRFVFFEGGFAGRVVGSDYFRKEICLRDGFHL